MRLTPFALKASLRRLSLPAFRWGPPLTDGLKGALNSGPIGSFDPGVAVRPLIWNGPQRGLKGSGAHLVAAVDAFENKIEALMEAVVRYVAFLIRLQSPEMR